MSVRHNTKSNPVCFPWLFGSPVSGHIWSRQKRTSVTQSAQRTDDLDQKMLFQNELVLPGFALCWFHQQQPHVYSSAGLLDRHVSDRFSSLSPSHSTFSPFFPFHPCSVCIDGWDFPGGPVARTQHYPTMGPGLSPWSGTKILQAT